MGHVSLKRLEKRPSLTTGTGAIKGVDATAHSDKCVTCKYTKMTKVISRMPPLKSTRRGERTFSDYWGPYKVANLQGSQYFLSFVDDFSRRSEVYFGSRLTPKENFQRYKAKFEVETGEKLGLTRTDNAKEYHALEKDLLKEGIQMEFTDPYTPEQNGVAERLNRTLMQMVRAMQLWAGLPREFWGEALMVANYLRNRLPTNTHGGKMTPYEAWYGRRPDLGHLRTYGCLVHARIPSERRDKMDVVSFQRVFVGYHSSKQYRIYNPKTKKIGWHSSLDFFEDWPGGPLLNVPTESGTFLVTLKPSISNSLMGSVFTDFRPLLDEARRIEDRRKDVAHHFPRPDKPAATKNSSQRSNSSGGQSSTQSSGGKSASSSINQTSSKKSDDRPNAKLMPTIVKPVGWVGTWYDPDPNPKKLKDDERESLSRQRRCWACRGSGHRGNDTICPQYRDKNLSTMRTVETDSGADSEAGKA